MGVCALLSFCVGSVRWSPEGVQWGWISMGGGSLHGAICTLPESTNEKGTLLLSIN